MRLLWLAVVALAPMFGAVDPSLIGLAMPDAKAIAGLDVQQSKNSSFGSYLLSQIDNHAFELLTRETGLDPRTDVANRRGEHGPGALQSGGRQRALHSAASYRHGCQEWSDAGNLQGRNHAPWHW